MAVVMENGSGSRLQLFLKSLLPSLFSNVSLFSLFKNLPSPFCNTSLLLQNCFAPLVSASFLLFWPPSPSPKFCPPVRSSLSHGAGAVNNDGEDGSSWQWL